MASIGLYRQVNFHLASHVPAEVHITKSLGFVGQVEYNGTSEFVVGHASAVGGLENVNAVPFAGALGTRGDT